MRKKNRIAALLLNDGYRSEGESDINGKHVKWDAGYCIAYVPYESTQVTKKLVDPTVAKAVEETLADVRWGALVSLEIRDKYITGVTVEADPVSSYDNE